MPLYAVPWHIARQVPWVDCVSAGYSLLSKAIARTSESCPRLHLEAGLAWGLALGFALGASLGVS